MDKQINLNFNTIYVPKNQVKFAKNLLDIAKSKKFLKSKEYNGEKFYVV